MSNTIVFMILFLLYGTKYKLDVAVLVNEPVTEASIRYGEIVGHHGQLSVRQPQPDLRIVLQEFEGSIGACDAKLVGVHYGTILPESLADQGIIVFVQSPPSLVQAF